MDMNRFKLLLLLIATALTVYVEAASNNMDTLHRPTKDLSPPVAKDNLTRVNLIFPKVESIDKVECAKTNASEEVFVNCTIDFRTRLIKYQIRNYDFTQHTGELVKMDTMHTSPAISKDWVYINGEEYSFREMEQRASDWLSKNSSGPLWNRKDMPDFIICDAYTRFKAGELEYDLCIHDLTINIRHSKSKTSYASAPALEIGSDDYFAPVTSAYAYNPSKTGDKLVFHLFWTDAAGRMKISYMIVGFDDPIFVADSPDDPPKYIDLSVIPNPITKNFTATWPKDADYMSKKPHLVEKFKADLEKKWRSDFIMAASPIYLSFNTTTNNSTNQSKAEPKVDSIGLCFVRGYRMFETTENGLVTNFDCRKDGVSQSEFVELPKLQKSFMLVTHAYHVANVNGYRFIHLFHSMKHNGKNQNRYVFCKEVGEYKQDKKLSSDVLSHILIAPMSTNSTYNRDSYCKVFGDAEEDRIHVTPSDIFAYSDGKVVKTISLWGSLYTVTNYDKPIETGLRDTAPKPKILENVEIRINAAFSTGQTVYMFTHNNIILIASMKMDASYQKLTIDFNSAEEVRTEEFIYNNFLRPKGDKNSLKEPFIYGLYEYSEGADDTHPPSGAALTNKAPESKPKPGYNPDFDPESETESKGSSTIWLIVIILVIAALILAALGYLFFMRGSGDQAPADEPRAAAPRAAPTRKASPDAELMVKTVRSQVKSVVR